LPADIRDKVSGFMAEAGLIYSCIDFIVTPEGRYVFLESNPRGQYLWIEHYTGMPITEAIADALMT
jgi:D-alanine-D-alanine ligase-like ATP-grasp enzyme